MSWYLTIRADNSYSRMVSTDIVTEWLISRSGVIQTSPLTFTFEQSSQAVDIVLVKCDPSGNYALLTYDYIPQINIIEFIIPYNVDATPFESLAAQLAAYLGWNAFEDAEDRQIWPPQ